MDLSVVAATRVSLWFRYFRHPGFMSQYKIDNTSLWCGARHEDVGGSGELERSGHFHGLHPEKDPWIANGGVSLCRPQNRPGREGDEKENACHCTDVNSGTP